MMMAMMMQRLNVIIQITVSINQVCVEYGNFAICSEYN